MRIAILDAKTLGDDISLDGFRQFGEVFVHQITKRDETIARLKGIDVAITNKVVLDREIIEASPALKLICIAATGMNNIDLEYAAQKGIAVKNVAGYSTSSVIQHTFGLLFYLLESLNYYDDYVKSGNWSKNDIFTHNGRSFRELQGKNWGIIGLGEIGRGVAQAAKAFGCNISYYSTSGKNQNKDFPRMELDELLSTSHIVSIHAPLNEKTKNLISYDKLGLLREESIIINVGRGGIINESDLARVLDEKNIFAGLDVMEKEPVSPNNPLFSIKNKERLFMTPHIAWASRESRERLVEKIIHNIRDFLPDSKA